MRCTTTGLIAAIAGTIAGVCLHFSCYYQPPGTAKHIPPMQEAVTAIPEEWLDEPVIVLSDTVDIRFRYAKSGNVAESRECIWYYVNKAHPEHLKNVVIFDFETMETSPLIGISLYYPDGSKVSAKPHEIKRFKGTDEESFTTNKMVNVYAVPRYQQGLIIRLEVSRNVTRPSYIRAEIFRDEYDCLEKQVTLTWPAECNIRHSIQNDEGLSITRTSSAQGPWRSVTLRAQRLKKIPAAYAVRYPERWYAGLHFSFPPRGARSMTWQETGDYYLDLIAASMVSSPEIKTQALSLPAASTAATVDESFRLLQRRVRYVAMEQEIYAIVPRAATEVFAKGYGDCKEMSVLLKMILAEKGVTAHCALVSTADRFQAIDSIPALGAFNHMIVYLPSFDGRPLFLDPTVRYGHARNSYYHLIYQKAMVLEKGNSRLVTIDPRENEAIARVFTSSKIKRSGDNRSWEMAGSISMHDRAAYLFFPYLKGLKGDENNPGLIAVLKNMFDIEPSSVTLDRYDSDSIRVRYTAPLNKQFVSIDKGGIILSSPSLFGGPGTFTTIKREGPRVFDRTEQTDEWIVPDGFTDLESVPLDHSLGRGTWSKKGARVSRTFSLYRTVAQAADEGGAHEFMRLQDKFFKATIWHK